MIVRKINESDIISVEEYQKSIFNDRKDREKKIIDFWFSKNKNECENSYILEDNGNIRGELLFSSMNYFYGGIKYLDFWAFDLIVDEELRKDGWGLNLMMKAFKEHNTCFCTGSGPLALKIEMKLGFYIIGEIRKYVRLINPLYFLNSIKRGNLSRDKYPEYIEVDNVKFDKINLSDMPNIVTPFNDNLLEIGRDDLFFKWRFKDLHEYVIYKQNSCNNYFVIRSFVKKGITAMVLVDFRCPLNKKNDYNLIINAAIKVTKRLRLPILVTGSSLSLSDEILERRRFKSIGRPRPIITKDKRYKEQKESQNNRNFCLVTLADSDGEVLL